MLSRRRIPFKGLLVLSLLRILTCADPLTAAPVNGGDSTWCVQVKELIISAQTLDNCLENYKHVEQIDDPKKVFYIPDYYVAWISKGFRPDRLDADSLRDALNERLTKKGLRKEDGTPSNTVALDVSVSQYKFQYVKGATCRFKVSTVWRMFDVVSGEEILNWSSSTVSDLQDELAITYQEHFNRAVFRGLDELLAKPDFAKLLKRKGPMFSNVYYKWEDLALPGPAAPAGKISDALGGAVSVIGQYGPCSGSIVSSQGHIVTSSYALADTSKLVKVRTHDGADLVASVLRVNRVVGIALLKLDKPTGLLLPLDTVRERTLGDQVFAIGTPSDISLGQSVSRGIISGQRIHDDVPLLQTDARMSPGNMGGPLLNETGSVIGVVVGKFVGRSIEGLGFAITIDGLEKFLRIQLPR